MKRIALLFCLWFFIPPAQAQVVKMKIAGVTTATFGEDVLAFEGSDTINNVISSGGGSASAKAIFELIKIKKLKDVSTNELWRMSLLGLHLADVTFDFFDVGGVNFYRISLKDATVNHFSFLSPECVGCGKMYHQVWFNYAKIEVTDVSSNVTVRFNRQTNATY